MSSGNTTEHKNGLKWHTKPSSFLLNNTKSSSFKTDSLQKKEVFGPFLNLPSTRVGHGVALRWMVMGSWWKTSGADVGRCAEKNKCKKSVISSLLDYDRVRRINVQSL